MCSLPSKENNIFGLTGLALLAATVVPEIAEAAQPGVSDSLRNLLGSVVAGGVVLIAIGSAVAGVSTFDPVKRRWTLNGVQQRTSMSLSYSCVTFRECRRLVYIPRFAEVDPRPVSVVVNITKHVEFSSLSRESSFGFKIVHIVASCGTELGWAMWATQVLHILHLGWWWSVRFWVPPPVWTLYWYIKFLSCRSEFFHLKSDLMSSADAGFNVIPDSNFQNSVQQRYLLRRAVLW